MLLYLSNIFCFSVRTHYDINFYKNFSLLKKSHSECFHCFNNLIQSFVKIKRTLHLELSEKLPELLFYLAGLIIILDFNNLDYCLCINCFILLICTTVIISLCIEIGGIALFLNCRCPCSMYCFFCYVIICQGRLTSLHKLLPAHDVCGPASRRLALATPVVDEFMTGLRELGCPVLPYATSPSPVWALGS